MVGPVSPSLAVDLPAGNGAGELTISFEPPRATAGLVAVGLGAVLLAVLLVLEVVRGRSRR